MRERPIATPRTALVFLLALAPLASAQLAPGDPTLMERIRDRQRRVCGAFTEVYWMDAFADDLEQRHRDIVLFTDVCAFHTFYEWDKDAEGKPLVARHPVRTRIERIAYRPIVEPDRWVAVWLEKVDAFEYARGVWGRIDWRRWSAWRDENGAGEAEMVAEALKEAGLGIVIQVIDADETTDGPDGRALRWVENPRLRNASVLTRAMVDEVLEHQRLTLARAMAQNARHMGIDPLDPRWNEEPLPFLAPGPYEGKCGEIEPCCDRPDPARGVFVEFPGALPVPLR
jgi:hypothetical protein